MTILVCSPHPDDEVMGMGGTIAEYARRGERIVVVIFSLAERTSIHRKDAIRARREREARKAAEILGVEDIRFLHLPNLRLKDELQDEYWFDEFAQLLKKEQPRAIFTTATDDGNSDHRAVGRFVSEVAQRTSYEGAVWMYWCWNPIAFLNRDQPQLIIDISRTLSQQWEALHIFESQKISVYRLMPIIFLRRLIHGIRHRCKFAEVFLQAPTKTKK